MSFFIGVGREITNTTIAPVAIPRFPDIINNTFGGNNLVNVTRPSWTDAIYNTFMIYPDAIGVMAYLIIALIPFAMMWISQGSARMAAISGLIVIGFVAFFLPANYMIAAYLCIITTTAATAYGLYKGSF